MSAPDAMTGSGAAIDELSNLFSVVLLAVNLFWFKLGGVLVDL